MINSKVRDIMNEQVKHEFFSAYLYLAMAAYFDSKDFDGMGQWMRCQAQEEMVHAMKFFNHIKDREGKVELLAIDKPQTEWASPIDAFKAAYKHEQFITAKINDIMSVAHSEKDFAAIPMLNWFVTEQIEEESTAAKVVAELDRVGNQGNGLHMLDRELGTRVFTLPPANAGADAGA